MTGYYDRAGNPITIQGFSTAFAGDRRVGLTRVVDYEVSTVYLVIDHNFGGGRPLIFETMVFKGGSAMDEYTERYSTEQEAREGHENVVGMVRALTDLTPSRPEPTGRAPYTVGAALRRHFRAGLDTLGMQWTEHKGLLESTFVVTGTRAQFAKLDAWVREIESQS